MGGPEDDANLVFETSHSVYITESRLCSAFMASGKNGKVIPLLGSFAPVSYVDQAARVMDEDEAEEEAEDSSATEENAPLSAYPFSLFDFRGEGYGKYGLLFYHPHLFDVQDNDILMEIGSAPELVKEIAEGKYHLYYYTKDGFAPVEDIRQESESCLAFRKSGKCCKVTEQGREYSLLLLEPEGIPDKSVMVSKIGFSSAGEGRAPSFCGTEPPSLPQIPSVRSGRPSPCIRSSTSEMRSISPSRVHGSPSVSAWTLRPISLRSPDSRRRRS